MASKSGNDPADTARNKMEEARKEVMDCEKKMQSIKEALRGIAAAATPATAADGAEGEENKDTNSLKISALKVSGLPEAAKPSFKIQISSPIEEISLTQLVDPLNLDVEGSIGLVKDVDISVATLTVTSANDADIYLGSSQELYDVAPLCIFDPLASKHNKITQLDIAILADDSTETPKSTTDTATLPTSEELEETKNDENNEAKEEGAEEEKETSEVTEETEIDENNEAKKGAEEVKETNEVTKETSSEPTDTETSVGETPLSEEIKDEAATTTEGEAIAPTIIDESVQKKEAESSTTEKDDIPATTPSVITPICVVTFKVEYTPSKKEERDALYELLNTTSKQKTLALEKLRKTAAAMSQTRQGTSSTALTTASMPPSKKPSTAVKSGFLNKKMPKQKEPTFFVKMYNRTIGPESMFRKVFPVAKNYCFFFGAIALFHFKGHELALPAPV